MSLIAVLRRPTLALLWLGQVCSSVGDYLYSIAALWIAVRLVGSRAGLVASADLGAALVVGLVGGALADRSNRRRAMVGADILRALAVLALPALAARGALGLPALVAVGVILGTLGALFQPALQASLPTLVPDPPALQAANALMDMTRRLARAIGPGLAGVLVALLPLPSFFTLDSATFVVSAVTILMLGSRYAWRPAAGPPRRLLADIREGLRAIADRPAIQTAFAALSVSNFGFSIAFTLGVPLLTAQVLRGTVGDYGLIVAAYGVGNVAANLVVAMIPIQRRAEAFFAGKLVLAAGFLLLAAAPNLPVAILASAVAAVGGPMGDIPLLTLIQLEVPAGLLGKAFSVRSTLSNAGAVLGTLVGVPLLGALGPRTGILLAGGLIGLAGASGLVATARAARRTPGSEAAAGD